MEETPRVLILGGGPAGMATALELWKAGIRPTVVERNAIVGGLARTLTFREGAEVFRTDIGPHRFFSKNPYLYQMIKDLLGEDWVEVHRLTRFYIRRKLYLYPIEWKNTLRNLGVGGTATILRDYLRERVRDVWVKEDPRTFEEFAVRTFGRSLAEFNMLNYTRKIWGVPTNELSVDWAHQRIKGLSFLAAVKNSVSRSTRGSGPKSLISSFYYPRYGTGLVYETIFRRLRGQATFHLSSQPTRIRHADGRVVAVDYTTPEGSRTAHPTHLVTSIPISELVALLDPPPPAEVVAAARALRYRSQAYLFLTIQKPQVFPDQWVYFPEVHIPFGRVSEMKNFSDAMAPPHATSLFIEFFCWEGDDLWRADTQTLLDRSLPFFQEFGWLQPSDIRRAYLHRQPNVYPVYDLQYAGRLAILKQYLDRFDNLFTIGRPGRFKYNNQDHSLEMGMLAARCVLEGTRHDFDAIADGDEYLERGVHPERRPQEQSVEAVGAAARIQRP